RAGAGVPCDAGGMTDRPRGRTWRLLVTEPSDGSTNMAVDEALWQGRRAGAAPPTIRFFAWAPPTVSLGYGQPLDRHVDLAACRRAHRQLRARARRPEGRGQRPVPSRRHVSPVRLHPARHRPAVRRRGVYDDTGPAGDADDARGGARPPTEVRRRGPGARGG